VAPGASTPTDARERQRAAKRILDALRRYQRSSPLAGAIRVDTLLRLAREPAGGARRPSTHRGAAPLALDDDALREVIEGLIADGRIERDGRRVRLAGSGAAIDPIMAQRVERLLAELRAAGASPPRVETLARRIGVQPSAVAQLRRSGRLVAVGPGIDYPSDVWAELSARVAGLDAGDGPPSVTRVRDELHTSRRHAKAILDALVATRG
jgi:hypothetical protein